MLPVYVRIQAHVLKAETQQRGKINYRYHPESCATNIILYPESVPRCPPCSAKSTFNKISAYLRTTPTLSLIAVEKKILAAFIYEHRRNRFCLYSPCTERLLLCVTCRYFLIVINWSINKARKSFLHGLFSGRSNARLREARSTPRKTRFVCFLQCCARRRPHTYSIIHPRAHTHHLLCGYHLTAVFVIYSRKLIEEVRASDENAFRFSLTQFPPPLGNEWTVYACGRFRPSDIEELTCLWLRYKKNSKKSSSCTTENVGVSICG